MSNEEKARIAFHEYCEQYGYCTNRNIEAYGAPYWDYKTENAWHVFLFCWNLWNKSE